MPCKCSKINMSMNNEKRFKKIKKEVKEKNDDLQSDESGERKSQASLMVELIEKEQGVILFHDELKDPHIRLFINNHHEIWRLRSKQFKRWAGKLFWDHSGKAINSDALNNSLLVLEGKAGFDGKQYCLSNRIAFFENAIWYDLADREWRAVKITSGGWEIVNDPPILFRRYSHHQAQVAPGTDGDVHDFLQFVNVADKKNQLLLLIYLVSCFIPDFPHPVINIYGSQGSAKSTLSKFLRKLIDPSAIEVSEFSRVPAELIQKFSHHWFVCFDNVSHIPEWVSDLVCKAVTGAGFSKRELYSDDEDVIYSFKRCIGINGINLVAAKPDLLERSILLELERINETDRKQEKVILEEFDLMRAGIIGAIFGAVSGAMEFYPTIQLSVLPRMADFATWGCAIAEAIGYSKEEFLLAYDQNIKQQNDEVLMESFEASAVIELMTDQAEWKGTSSDLLSELKRVASESLGIDTDKEKSFPKAASVLSRRLNQLRPNLETVGIKIQRVEENKKRIIYIQKVDGNAVSVVDASENTEVSPKQEDDTSDESRHQAFPLSSHEISLSSAEINDGYARDDNNSNILGLNE